MRNPSIGGEDFIILSPKRKSFGRPLESELQSPVHHHYDGQDEPVPFHPLLRSPGSAVSAGVSAKADAETPVSPVLPSVVEDALARPAVAGGRRSARGFDFGGEGEQGDERKEMMLRGRARREVGVVVPEAGDPSRRHETTNLFYPDDEDEELVRNREKLDKFI